MRFLYIVCLLGLIAFGGNISLAKESKSKSEKFPIEIKIYESDYIAEHSCTYMDIEVSKLFGGEKLARILAYSNDNLSGGVTVSFLI